MKIGFNIVDVFQLVAGQMQGWLFAISLALAAPAQADETPLVVFAASSLKEALDDIVLTSGAHVVVSYASSAALARQIDQAAPADIFLSANTQWVDWLADRGGLVAASKRDLLTNALVLVSHDKDHGPADLADDATYADGLLAVGLVNAVPAGIYAKAALTSLGVWAGVQDRVVQAQNVRQALAYVALAEVDLGVVYETDARAEPRVKIIGVFPADSHPQITYVGALTSQSVHPNALPFLASLATPEASAIFERHGFGLLNGTPKR